MSRWEPDAPARLQQAAFELCSAQGYHQTTVAAIAASVGLTERTFYRHFADKREALFQGSDVFRTTIADAVLGAPATASALEATTFGIIAGAFLFPARELVRRRHQLIAANIELQEREMNKLHFVAASIAEALCRRGVEVRAAELASETGVTVLRVALARWVEDPVDRPFDQHVHEVLNELRRLAVGPPGVA